MSSQYNSRASGPGRYIRFLTQAFLIQMGYSVSDRHNYKDLIRIFDDLFLESEKTRLVRGDDEPVYLPASMTGSEHHVVFAHGFYASAMHEIAHWCVAGKERRLSEDYGYWYEPDGRTEVQQRLFEQVEIVPQAMEKCFCLAAGFQFRVSVDNLNGSPGDTTAFAENVDKKAQEYLRCGLPARAQAFFDALSSFYQTGAVTVLSPFYEKNNIELSEEILA